MFHGEQPPKKGHPQIALDPYATTCNRTSLCSCKQATILNRFAAVGIAGLVGLALKGHVATMRPESIVNPFHFLVSDNLLPTAAAYTAPTFPFPGVPRSRDRLETLGCV